MYDIQNLILPQNKPKFYQYIFHDLSTLSSEGQYHQWSELTLQQPITAHQVCFQADGGRFLCFVLTGE